MKTFWLAAVLMIVGCSADVDNDAAVSPVLLEKAEAYVSACIMAREWGASVSEEECQCLANSVLDYIPEEEAVSFFTGITPLYDNPDKKRRDDNIDRFFRDLIQDLAPESRVAWNTMFTQALPMCRDLSSTTDG